MKNSKLVQKRNYHIGNGGENLQNVTCHSTLQQQ